MFEAHLAFAGVIAITGSNELLNRQLLNRRCVSNRRQVVASLFCQVCARACGRRLCGRSVCQRGKAAMANCKFASRNLHGRQSLQTA